MEKHDEDKTTETSFIVWEALKSIICNNIDYYKSDETTNGLKLHGALLGIIDEIDEARPLYAEIESFCSDYDLDENTKANGYRSYLKVFDAAINHTLKILKYVTENRSGLLFRKTAYTKEIEACNHLLGALIASFHQLIHLHTTSEGGNLFSAREHSPDEVLARALTINQFAFYGRCLGFQYFDSIRPVLKFIAISMACYSESYYSKSGTFIKATNSMFTSGKYYFDPELRARRIVNLSQHASVDFCKNFWFLAEMEIMHSIPFVNFSVKVNRLIKINTEPLRVEKVGGETIEVKGPGTIQVRLISSHRREGMVGEKKDGKCSDHVLPKSRSIILHAHGGGFVAQSSKSHLVYLLEWAVNLNVPILSLDYSLSPEHPYPRPLEEMLYTYCWILKNAELLGTTAERIVLCGDSAGANLCLSTLLKCIDMKIRKPDGVFLAYCPILVAFDPSPSRLLCLMDPLIPFGFMIRCLRAFSNGESVASGENDAAAAAVNLRELEELKRAKADRNEELKRKSSLNMEAEQPEFSSENSDRTDSFEEISCFERHQTDSDIKAHISQASDVEASNDTLAGTSFLTGTDFKNSRDTIEVVSPIDSIRSATSLEEDSLPITVQRNERRANSEELADVDLQPTTSEDTTIKNSHGQFVDEFIGKYVLGAEQHRDGLIKPVLRKVSRTRSEENIVFDVSKETLSVRTFQQKVNRVASTLVHACSSTLGQITRTNRPITKNFSCDDADELRLLDSEEVPHSSTNDFLFTVSKDPFMSPFYADDDALRQFPAIRFLSLTLDACLDDSITYVKRLKRLNVDYKLDILEGLPHGFLNFARISKDAHEGSKVAMTRIAELLNITLDEDETKVKYYC